MSQSPLHLLSLSLSRQALVPGSRERERFVRMGETLAHYHCIVLSGPQAAVPARSQEGNVTFYAITAKNKLWRLLLALRHARKIAKQRHANERWLITSQDPFEPGLIAALVAWWCRLPFHLQLHGDLLHPAFRVGSPLNQFRYRLAAWLLPRAAGVRVVSERIKRSVVAHGVDRERISVLPIQADLRAFLAVGVARHYRADAECQLLYVGRLAPEKRLPHLLRALAAARAQGALLSLTIVGDGPERTALTRLASELQVAPAVTFAGWREDVPAAMADADAFVLNSAHEGWAMVLVEAMAAGLPVVTTDVGCAGELLKHREHGLVVPPEDTPALTAALIELANDQAQRAVWGRAGHQTATAFFKSDVEYATAWRSTFTTAEPQLEPGILTNNGSS